MPPDAQKRRAAFFAAGAAFREKGGAGGVWKEPEAAVRGAPSLPAPSVPCADLLFSRPVGVALVFPAAVAPKPQVRLTADHLLEFLHV